VFSLSKEKRPKWAPFLETKKAAEGGLGVRYRYVIPEVSTGLKGLLQAGASRVAPQTDTVIGCALSRALD
jgi:hypothetical protein